MRRTAILVAAIALGACTPTSVTPTPIPTAQATATVAAPTSAPTRSPIAGIPRDAVISPDGKFLAVTDQNARTFKLLGPDGSVVRQASGFFNQIQWIPDSSGVLFGSSAPQRAAPLGIFEVDGRITHTELQLADTVVSLDGRIIAAAHQEGCCASVIQREIRVSPRSGGPAGVLVRSTTPVAMTQPLWILGVAADGRLVYRDGQRFGLIAFDGTGAQEVQTPRGLDASRLFAFQSAPDRSAILLRTYEPFSWWLYSSGMIRPLPAGTDPITTERRTALWLPGALLVNVAGSRVGTLDPATLAVRDLPIVLPAPIVPQPPQPPISPAFAAGNGKLLWLDGARLRISDLATGGATDARLAVSDPRGMRADALPGGGFLVWLNEGAYRVEAGP